MLHRRASLLLSAFIILAPAAGCKDAHGGSADPGSGKAGVAPAPAERVALLPSIEKYVASAVAGFDAIPAERRQQLDELALFVRSRRSSGGTAKLIFICTHNSRRSHLSQLFATVAAAHFGIDHVESYSGGIEVTAFNPRAVAALERVGFTFEKPGGDNPHYKVTYASNRLPVEAFSKKYDDPVNPKAGFAAVMTCAHADKACPIVAGATLRVGIPYDDPKEADGTPAEAATYDERTKQIATEMLYVFSRVSG